jgi:peptidoglycan/LPS O-acetylase OafA/YrhL
MVRRLFSARCAGRGCVVRVRRSNSECPRLTRGLLVALSGACDNRVLLCSLRGVDVLRGIGGHGVGAPLVDVVRDKHDRLLAWEACRGVAALVVLAAHFVLAFLPELNQVTSAIRGERGDWAGNVAYAFINGTAAVVFFFVLSGYVLSLPFVAVEKQGDGLRQLIASIVRRWPRLALPCAIAATFSAVILMLGLNFNAAAASISGSPWLLSFAGVTFPSNWQPGVFEALLQGGVMAFLRGECFYNSSLWTMHFELLGSVIVWGSLLVGRFVGVRHGSVLAFLIALVAALLIHLLLVAFVCGLGVAFWGRRIKVLPVTCFVLLLIAVYFFGWIVSAGHYAWLGWFWARPTAEHLWLASMGASVLLMISVMNLPPVSSVVCSTCARWLGRLSFPLYLIHVPVIMSFSCWLYVRFSGVPLIVNALATGLVCGLLAFLLFLFDRWWVVFCRRRADRIVGVVG